MLTTGQSIYLVIGHATAHCAIAVSGVYATVVAETDKAVQLSAYGDHKSATTAWLPRKAIVSKTTKLLATDQPYTSHKLAHWFRPEGYVARWIDRNVSHSTLAA